MSDPAENRDVRGNTIKPHSVEAENVNAKNATVESEPSEANEIARKVDIDAKADLDSTTGVLKSSQVPDLAITSVSTVPDQSSRLSLSVEEGDVAIQTDTDTTFIFTGGDPSVNSNWSEIVLDVLDAISGSTISPDTVNANSVNTEEAIINLDLPSGTSDEILSLPATTNGVSGADRRQFTSAVSTSASSILIRNGNGKSHVLVMVTGGDGLRNRFHDILHFASAAGTSDVISSVTQGSPAGRTYGDNGESLTLTMDSGTYDIMARGVENAGF